MKTLPLTDHYLAAAAAIHAASFPRSLSPVLGPRYVKALLRLHADHPDCIALVAVENGQVAGYLIGSLAKLPVHQMMLGTVARCVLRRPWLIFNRQVLATATGKLKAFRRQKETALSTVELPTVKLFGIGVLPAYRGRGVAKQLIRDFEYIAADRYREPKLVLSTERDNIPAQSLYRKLGWRLFKQDAINYHYQKVLA